MKKITNKGFTLIELLVVVAIIAILALIVMLAINPVEMARRSRDSRRLSDLATVRKAIDLALADGKEVLPGTVLVPVVKTTAGGGTLLSASDKANNLVGMDIGKYLSTIPQDPSYENDATTVQTTNGTCPSGVAQIAKSAMVYRFASDGSGYVLSSYIESTDNCKVPSGDGNNTGASAGLYEIGSDPGLDL